MVSTPEGFTDNSPNAPMKSTPVKKPSARKALRLFTNILDVKPKIAKRRIVVEKFKRRAIKVGKTCGPRKKRKGHSKINEQIKRNLYTWITLHPQVFQSPISNDRLKFMLDDYLEAGTRRAGVEELTMILPPWIIERERVGSLLMWF